MARGYSPNALDGMVPCHFLCSIALTGVYFGWKDDNDGLSQSVQSLHEAVTFVARRFQAAIALMLGFYTMQVFNRWREARAIEGNAMGTINDLALQLAWRIGDTQNTNEKRRRRMKRNQNKQKRQQRTCRLTRSRCA